ncbi:hypothetical protein WNZ14_10580 [Hoeflea sp. AS60]|uniref:hypothetical protein n=1 Tax=Hoeflea sp. AS60 TaxID=3135780 RepID=UPI00317354F4
MLLFGAGSEADSGFVLNMLGSKKNAPTTIAATTPRNAQKPALLLFIVCSVDTAKNASIAQKPIWFGYMAQEKAIGIAWLTLTV